MRGGGARGYIELVFLSELEKETKLPVYKLFDLFGGTSIGGILASALTAPNNNTKAYGNTHSGSYTATYLCDQFESLSKSIFKKSCCCNFFGLCGPKYDSSGITGVAENMFGNFTFNQSLKPTLVPSYDMSTNKPKFFKSWRPEQGIFYTCDVALATSAAPTYFEPHLMESIGGDTKGETYKLLDGGTAVNDPSHCLTVEAKKNFGASCKLKIVSLGTGDLNDALPFEGLRRAGILS